MPPPKKKKIVYLETNLKSLMLASFLKREKKRGRKYTAVPKSLVPVREKFQFQVSCHSWNYQIISFIPFSRYLQSIPQNAVKGITAVLQYSQANALQWLFLHWFISHQSCRRIRKNPSQTKTSPRRERVKAR